MPHLLPVEPVRNPDLGPEAPRGVPEGDSIMILEKIIEIPLRLRLQYKLTMLGKKLLMHFCKIWVLQLDLALRLECLDIPHLVILHKDMQCLMEAMVNILDIQQRQWLMLCMGCLEMGAVGAGETVPLQKITMFPPRLRLPKKRQDI